MRDITILHLYNDTLDLYGDYFNLTALRNRIVEMGGSCTVLTANLEDEDIPLEQADLVYMGHGKARNLAAVAPHFAAFGQRIIDAVEGGKVFFVTGNSRLLFGKEFEGVTEGLTHKGIGLFDYTGTETNKVFTSDVFGRCCFDQTVQTYGFINRTQHIVGENTYPLFQIEQGACDGTEATGVEGTHYKNFYATWQMGPILERNPALLLHLLTTLLGDEMGDYDDTFARKALERVLAEK